MVVHRHLALTATLLLSATSLVQGQAPVPAALPNRWQVTLNDQSYLWDVRLVRLAGDTLVVKSPEGLMNAPVARITELRLLPETVLQVQDGHRSAIGALGDDNVRVVDFMPLSMADRRAAIERILAIQASGS